MDKRKGGKWKRGAREGGREGGKRENGREVKGGALLVDSGAAGR